MPAQQNPANPARQEADVQARAQDTLRQLGIDLSVLKRPSQSRSTPHPASHGIPALPGSLERYAHLLPVLSAEVAALVQAEISEIRGHLEGYMLPPLPVLPAGSAPLPRSASAASPDALSATLRDAGQEPKLLPSVVGSSHCDREHVAFVDLAL
jgi:hypothetical protein